MEPLGRGTVSSVIDGRTFRLDDGREVRLAAIEAPSHGRSGQAAKAALRDLIEGRSVALSRLGSNSDRYGRVVAYAALAGDGTGTGVQPALLAQGHARVAASIESGRCAQELLAAEQAARTRQLGLWSDPYYAVRSAENSAGLLAEQGRFAVIEGKVASVRESGGTIYVNFGRRWIDGFAVTILKRNERLFAATEIDLRKLEGRTVRVRGWIEERRGPRVEATHPAQIEVMVP